VTYTPPDGHRNAAADLRPCPPPADLGLVCPGCRATTFTTRWQTFSNGTRHIKMSCAVCGRFIRYLSQKGAPAFRHEPRKPGAHA
jgi:hypothetical protein